MKNENNQVLKGQKEKLHGHRSLKTTSNVGSETTKQAASEAHLLDNPEAESEMVVFVSNALRG